MDEDWSQANDLAEKMPEKLAEMKELFYRVRQEQRLAHRRRPVGPVLHPELRIAPPYTRMDVPRARSRGCPSSRRPRSATRTNVVTMDADVPANANGVLYALGGFSGGLALYVKDGMLSYEYNLFEIQRTHIKAKQQATDRQGENRGADDLCGTQSPPALSMSC